MNVSSITVKGSDRREEAAGKVVAGATKERRQNKSKSQKSYDDFLSLLTSVWQMENGFIHRLCDLLHMSGTSFFFFF